MIFKLLWIVFIPAEICSYQNAELPRSHSHWIRQSKFNRSIDNTSMGDNEVHNSTLSINLCSSCFDRELKRNITLTKLKRDILEKLNMFNGPPQVSRKDINENIVQQILRSKRALYEHFTPDGRVQNDEEEFHCRNDPDFQPQQLTIIAQNPSRYVPRKIIRKWDIRYFPLKALLENDNLDIDSAKLYFQLPLENVSSSISGMTHFNFQQRNRSAEMESFLDTVYIHLSYVVIDKTTQEGRLIQAITKSDNLLRAHNGWLHLDMVELLSKWVRYPSENLGLHIMVKNKLGNEISFDVQNQATSVPFLQIDVRKNCRDKRNRRNTIKTCREPKDNNYKKCCLWDFEVDFEVDFGWDWVLHPVRYNVGYCMGECDIDDVHIPTYARILQQSQTQPLNQLCCTPRQTSEMAILYLDHNRNVILGKLPDMKVDKCGCA